MTYIQNMYGSTTGNQKIGSITVNNGGQIISKNSLCDRYSRDGDFNNAQLISIANTTGLNTRFDDETYYPYP